MNTPSALDTSVAQFEDLQHRLGLLDMVKRSLGDLLDKGVALSSQDVTDAAGRLVAGGLKPEAMASLLSQMPDKPEALQQWVQHYAELTEQREEQLESAMTAARHQMGVAGMVTLAGLLDGHAATGGSGNQQPQPSTQPQPAQPSQLSPAAGNATPEPSAPASGGAPAGNNVLGI